MKVYKATVLIYDREGHGPQSAIDTLENNRYVSVSVRDIEERDIEWSDEHPLNKRGQWEAAFEELFGLAAKRHAAQMAEPKPLWCETCDADRSKEFCKREFGSCTFVATALSVPAIPGIDQGEPSGASVDSELLPCPFCGAEPLAQEIEAHTHAGGIAGFMPDHPGSATIECPTTNCCGMIADTAAEVRAAWNRRASVDSVARNAARYRWLRSWFMRGGMRAEIHACGHMERTTAAIVDAGVDAAMSPTKAGEAEP